MSRNLSVALGIVALAVVITVLSALFVVRQTEQAVVTQFGEPRAIVTDPGLHLKMPFIQSVIFFDKRVLALDTPAEEVIASDQKRLVMDAFARFRISEPLRFYQAVGNESVARARLGAIVNSSLRQVFGSEPFASVLSGGRAGLMRRIRDAVNEEARGFGIDVVDVRIKRADLPQENSQAIFRRMQTERERDARETRALGAEEALRIRAQADRERTVLLAEAERDAEVTRGQGDAERNRIFAEAYSRDPQFFAFYRTMSAYRASLKGEDTTMVLTPESDFFRYFSSEAGTSVRAGQ